MLEYYWAICEGLYFDTCAVVDIVYCIVH